MAENENDTAVADTEAGEEQEYTYNITIEDAVPATKRVVVDIPRDRIHAKIAVTDEHVRQALQNLKEQQGARVPGKGCGIEDKACVPADVTVRVDGEQLAQQTDAQIVSRPGRVAGSDVVDLDKQLRGAKSG